MGKGQGDRWPYLLEPYYAKRGKKGLATCPMANKQGDGGGTTYTVWGPWGSVTGKTPLYDRGSYGVNGWAGDPPIVGWRLPGVIYWEAGEDVMGGHWPHKDFWRKVSIRNASQVPLFQDSFWFHQCPDDTNPPPQRPDVGSSAAETQIHGFMMDRHNRGIQCTFLEGV